MTEGQKRNTLRLKDTELCETLCLLCETLRNSILSYTTELHKEGTEYHRECLINFNYISELE